MTIVTRRVVAASAQIIYSIIFEYDLSSYHHRPRTEMLAGLHRSLYLSGSSGRYYSTNSALKIFSDHGAAEFLAAAATVESLPTIGSHPPEVRHALQP